MSEAEIDRNCYMCRFFNSRPESRWLGGSAQCRRHAPVSDRTWPLVDGMYWCGDWEPAPDEVIAVVRKCLGRD